LASVSSVTASANGSILSTRPSVFCPLASEYDLGRQIWRKTTHMNLVETNIDPQALGSISSNCLARHNRGTWIGIARYDQTINRRDQLQIPALCNQGLSLSTDACNSSCAAFGLPRRSAVLVV
jgi:hypothetical protein